MSSAGLLSPRGETAAITTNTAFQCGLLVAEVKPGTVYGATDEWGYKAVENRLEMHDLHATMLHLMGVDHTRSTFRFSGRDMRLTDVHGHVVHEIVG